MAESVYKVIELIGTSKDSWEKAAAAGKFLFVRSETCKRQILEGRFGVDDFPDRTGAAGGVIVPVLRAFSS